MWKYFKQSIEKYLSSEGIDIHSQYYKEAENYKRIAKERIIGPSDFGSMPMDEFIERFLLTKQEVAKTYESIYDMGNPQELTDDQCEDIDVAREIITKYTLTEEGDIDAEANELVKKFYRNGGLLERIKKYLGLDLEAYDKNNKQFKRERCKILYLFYALEHDCQEKFNVLQLLSKPSMENIDNASLKMETRNGSIIGLIKGSLEKELSLDVKKKIKDTVANISQEWDLILQNAYRLVGFLYEKGQIYDFESIINTLSSGSEDLQIPKSPYVDTLSPIEVLYLRITQHEYRGMVKDIETVNNIRNSNDYNVPSELVEEMKRFQYSMIDIENVEQYIEDNSVKIAKYVYLGKKTNKDDINRIRAAKKKIFKWLDFCAYAKPLLDLRYEPTELQIISFLQAVILDDSSEIFDYTFYRYETHSKHIKRVQAALKNDGYVPYALQCYWVRKVSDHWFANLGRYEERIRVRELENVCDGIREKILSESSLNGMKGKHAFFLDKVNVGLITTSTQIEAARCFEKYINDMGFKYIDEYCLIRYIFLYPPEIYETLTILTPIIDWAVKNKESRLNMSPEVHSANGKELLEFSFNLNFDYQLGVCIMEDFNMKM